MTMENGNEHDEVITEIIEDSQGDYIKKTNDILVCDAIEYLQKEREGI